MLTSRCSLQDPALKKFAGDNFVRKSGDYHGFEALQLHSLAAQDRGQSLNLMVCYFRNTDRHLSHLQHNFIA